MLRAGCADPSIPNDAGPVVVGVAGPPSRICWPPEQDLRTGDPAGGDSEQLTLPASDARRCRASINTSPTRPARITSEAAPDVKQTAT